MKEVIKRSFIKKNWIAIAAFILLLFRLVMNGLVPLMDKTEARYAEIARIMSETNNWITLQIDYGVPFWAKPPLSTWLSALSFEVFGVNEFSARLPYFLASLFIILFVGKYAKRKNLHFFLPGLILLTLPEFYLHAGVVSTDTMLTFCVVLVMISFWETISGSKRKLYQYLFFVGVGLGLLAKGPIIIILTAPPIFLWTLLTKKFKEVLTGFPWVIGTLLTLLIAVPWYYLAEIKSPGFIDYFVIGEHFSRYFDSTWTGDKYGFPKIQPFGIIWLFLFLFALPWIQVIIVKLFKRRNVVIKNQWTIFLFLWLLWTPLFFTISKSLIHPYTLPVMVPVALLIVEFWETIKAKLYIIGFVLVLNVILIVSAVYIFNFKKNEVFVNTDKYLLEENSKNNTLYYLNKKSYSSQFYSHGNIIEITEEELKELISKKDSSTIVIIKNKDFKKLSSNLKMKLNKRSDNSKKGVYSL